MLQPAITNRTDKRTGAGRELWSNRALYLMCVPAMVLLLMFCYVPLGGLYMAFTNFNAVDGIFGSPFVGLDNFLFFFNNPYCWTVIKNTLVINFFGILLGTALPVTIAPPPTPLPPVCISSCACARTCSDQVLCR